MTENPVLKWDLVVASGPDLLPKITLSCLYLGCQLPILGTFIIKGTSHDRLLPSNDIGFLDRDWRKRDMFVLALSRYSA